MTQSSEAEREQHRKEFQEHLAKERASGEPIDTSWTDDLPDDPLPTEDEDTSVTFIKKSPSGS